jgi:cation diffusion facilitator CzcD-associated flavoprotein CzcO/predicted ATP-grasp superfamily ATP-dependent carboligase
MTQAARSDVAGTLDVGGTSVHPEWPDLAAERASREFDILVLDAMTKQSLATARSLGRAGLRVALGEFLTACAGFRSRYSARNLVLPSFAEDPAAFATSVVDFVRQHPTRVVLPTVDGSIAAMRPQRAQLAALGCVLALPAEAALAIANDKDRTLELARSLGIAYPKTMRIESAADVAAAVSELGFPMVLKPAVSWSAQASRRLVPAEVVDQAEAVQVTARFLSAGATVLAQQWASGRREGVTLFFADGELLACCAHVAHRTTPPLGGVSTMRESIPVPADIYEPAVSLATAIGLDGVCEVEFRRDATGRPLLMEVNARLSGTIENSVRSGVDLPLMIWQSATGQPVDRAKDYKTGVRTRCLGGDFMWLRDTLRRPGRPDSVPRARALWLFGSEFLRSRHYDFVDRHDLRPAIAKLREVAFEARQWLRSRARLPIRSSTGPIIEREGSLPADEVLIIGAGPAGLSISAHLRALGVGHRIVGRPMDAWRAHMPAGMYLKSEPYASDFSAPGRGYDVAAYFRATGLQYVARKAPLSLEHFLGYADWYADQLAPDVADATVADLGWTDDGRFRVAFAGGEAVTASKVVLATGILPFAHIPEELSGLPADLVSHSSDVPEPARFRGRRVAVVGAGQSALETAALLHEAGAEVQLVVRRWRISWLYPNPASLSPIGHIRRPVTKLCEGWACAFYASPAAFRLLPRDVKVTKARTVLGPSGAWWLKDRVDGKVATLTAHSVKGAVAAGSGVQLLLDGPARSSVDADHVVAATGFRVELTRLPFLSAGLAERIATLGGYPVLSRNGQSSVPGLYFAGAPATVSLGPSMRFVAGTHNLARQMARSLAAR